MLVNEQTQSQAEHTGLFFEAATKVTFIGSPTAGANADGRQLQRIGIVPDLLVQPTIAGLAAGRLQRGIQTQVLHERIEIPVTEK
ncbi:MAG: hypothetical protein NT117_00990 [Gammaproteobacteria bacterium]|nr:hypothetical protein [Gammaproteobacteria bacterium]